MTAHFQHENVPREQTMAWILLVISLFIHTLSAYAMGDIVVHALQYEVTKGVIFGNVAILLGCILVRLFLDKFLVSTNAGKHGTAGVDCIVYIIGTVFAAVLLELNVSYEMSQGLVMTLLFLTLMIMAEKDLYLGIFLEEEEESPPAVKTTEKSVSLKNETVDIPAFRKETAANHTWDRQRAETSADSDERANEDDDEVSLTFIDPAPAEKRDEVDNSTDSEDDEVVLTFADPAPAAKRDEVDENADDDEVVLTFADPAPAEKQEKDDEEDGLIFIDPVPERRHTVPVTSETNISPVGKTTKNVTSDLKGSSEKSTKTIAAKSDVLPEEKRVEPAAKKADAQPVAAKPASRPEPVTTRTEVKTYAPRTEIISETLTSRDIVYIIFFGIGCLAFITLGIFALITLRQEDSRYGFFAGMGIAAAAAVIFRQLGRGLAPEEKDETEWFDKNSPEYWEAQDRAEAARRKSVKVNGILFGILTVLMTVLLCFSSAFIGFVYLLGAFLVAVIIPMCFYRWGIGGIDVIRAKTDMISRLVSRVFAVMILLIATWQLSYGALWEIEYLLILAVTCVTQDYLTRQNR